MSQVQCTMNVQRITIAKTPLISLKIYLDLEKLGLKPVQFSDV